MYATQTKAPRGLLCSLAMLVAVTAMAGIVCANRAVAAPPTIFVLDLRWTSSLPAAQQYDIRHAAACIQGLANRQAPRVFLEFVDADATWLTRLTEPGGLCEGWEVRNLTDICQLPAFFRHCVNGLVIYDADPNTGVISTSLAATTAAGVEGAIAIRKDATPGSVYDYLVNTMHLPVLIDLTGRFTGTGTIWQTTIPSTGSRKCDAYIWAKSKYIDTGRCDPTVLSYTLDLWGLKVDADLNCQLSNLDYAVYRKGFCFEISPWDDEQPNDDPTQPLGTDLSTMRSVLDACNARTGQSRMIKCCGFPNWMYKYSTAPGVGGSHPATSTEWQLAKLLSAYNAYLEADAAGPSYIANGSFYAGLLPEMSDRRYVQNPPPTYNDMASRGLINGSGQVVSGNYVLLGMGDYDSASWPLYSLACDRYDDPVRGQVYCTWGVDPNAVDRASVAMDYMYSPQVGDGLLHVLGFRSRICESWAALRLQEPFRLLERCRHLDEALQGLLPCTGLLHFRLASERLGELDLDGLHELRAVQWRWNRPGHAVRLRDRRDCRRHSGQHAQHRRHHRLQLRRPFLLVPRHTAGTLIPSSR